MTTDVTESAGIRTTAATQITAFWARDAAAQSRDNALYIGLAGEYGGHSMAFLFGANTPVADQVTVADRVLAGVQRWRDGIVERNERQRTAEDELAAAREEIARLKAERDGGDDA